MEKAALQIKPPVLAQARAAGRWRARLVGPAHNGADRLVGGAGLHLAGRRPCGSWCRLRAPETPGRKKHQAVCLLVGDPGPDGSARSRVDAALWIDALFGIGQTPRAAEDSSSCSPSWQAPPEPAQLWPSTCPPVSAPMGAGFLGPRGGLRQPDVFWSGIAQAAWCRQRPGLGGPR